MGARLAPLQINIMTMNHNTQPYWKQFRKTLISPQFHWFFLKSRIKANLIDAPLYRRLLSIIFISTLLTVITLTNQWLTFLIAWILPLTVGYHIAALSQVASEHLWGTDKTTEYRSHGRFCGEDPPIDATFLNWLSWTFKMLFYHLPVRLAILSDPEICAHDHHHYYPKDDKDWPNAIYNRQKQVEAEANYKEFWGIHTALEAVFQSLANTSPLSDTDINRLTR
jgi:hypothetical protein